MSDIFCSKNLFSLVIVLFLAFFSSIVITIFDSLPNVYKQPLIDSNSTRYLSNQSTTESFNTTNFTLNEQNELSNYNSANTQWSLIVYSLTSGIFLGNLLSGLFPFPKRITLFYNNFFFIVGFVIILFSQNLAAIAISRVLIGFGIGIVFSTVPVYLQNINPNKGRRLIQFLFVICIFIGSVIGLVLSYYFNTVDNWMYGLIIMLIFFAVLTLVFCFVQKDYQVYQSKPMASIWSLLCNKKTRKSILIIIFLQMAEEFSRINSVLFFMPAFFKNTNNYEKLGSWFFMLIVNHFILLILWEFKITERLLSLQIALGPCLFALILLMFTCYTFEAVLMLIFGFDIGLGLIRLFFTFEVFPNEHKASVNFISVSLTWILAFFIPFIIELYFPKHGISFFIGYIFCLAIGVYFVAFQEELTGSIELNTETKEDVAREDSEIENMEAYTDFKVYFDT